MPEAERTGRDGATAWGWGTQCSFGGALFNPESTWRKLASMGRKLEFMGQGWGTAAVNGLSTRGCEKEQGEADHELYSVLPGTDLIRVIFRPG